MLSFAWPYLFILLPLPLLFKTKQKQQTGHLHLPGVGHGQQANLSSKGKPKRILLWLMWALLITAVARPLWVGEPIELPAKGRDLMVAVDLSGSMQIDDMVLNGQNVDRFTVIQHVVSDFIDRRKGDRIGLILFADHAYLQAPLTLDRKTVAQYLREAQIGLVGKQTAIGEAIALGVKRFDKLDNSNKVLILLTDGSNNAGNIAPLQAAELAKDSGVKVYTIGVGADEMLRRSLFGTQRVNPSSDLDEATLTKIAQITGGEYFRARDPQQLQQIYHEIDKLQPVSRDQLSYRPQTELFYWPLAFSLLASALMAIGSLPLFQRKRTEKSQ